MKHSTREAHARGGSMSKKQLPPRNRNQAALRRLRPSLHATYPKGHFVAIGGGQVIGHAPTFADLEALLRQMGRAPGESLVVEIGAELPESVNILI
jgi:hypothetical protein